MHMLAQNTPEKISNYTGPTQQGLLVYEEI